MRLTKFSELNRIRVVFRFLFTIPLLILGVDGVAPHHHVNEKMIWTDLLIVISGFGCAISSAITLVIFFPRSIEGEIAARDAEKERKRSRSHGLNTVDANLGSQNDMRDYRNQQASSTGGTYLLTSSPIKKGFSLKSFDNDGATDDDHMRHSGLAPIDQKKWDEEERDRPAALPPFRPNRKRDRDIELGNVEGLTEANLSLHNLHFSNVNPMVSNFTSPIDFMYHARDADNASRLTFNRR